jgi:hypothetical protein
MGHELRLTRDSEYSGELSLGLAEGGTLEFDDGVATVPDEARAEAIAGRYPAIEYPAADTESDEDDDGDDAFDAVSFVDRTPMDDVVEDIESGDYDAHLDAIAAAEADGRDREGVADAVDARRE